MTCRARNEDANEATFAQWCLEPDMAPVGQVRPMRPVVRAGTQSGFTVRLAPGQKLAKHATFESVVLVGIEGTTSVAAGSRRYQVSEGACLLMAPGVDHALENTSHEPALLVGIAQWVAESGDGPKVAEPQAAFVQNERVGASPGRADAPVSVDAIPWLLGATGNGVSWTLLGSGELNMNLVRLEPGEEMGEHVNDAVDVALIALVGSADLKIGEEAVALHPGVVAHIPRGSRRRLRAGSLPFGYLTVHRRRHGLSISRRGKSR